MELIIPLLIDLTKKLISRLDQIYRCKTFGPILIGKNTTFYLIFTQPEVNLNFDYPIIFPEAIDSCQIFRTMTLHNSAKTRKTGKIKTFSF